MTLVDGEVAGAREFDFAALRALPEQVADVAQLIPGRRGGAVRLRALLDAAGARREAAWATLRSSDGFAIAVPLAAVQGALVTYRLGEAPLPVEQGGPVRFLVPGADQCGTPDVDACANVKKLARVTLTVERDESAKHDHPASRTL